MNLAYLALTAIVSVLVVAPLIPAWLELKRPSDLQALPISVDYATDHQYFARQFKEEVMSQPQKFGVRTGSWSELTNDIDQYAKSSHPLVVTDTVALARAMEFSCPMMVEGSFASPAGARFTCLYIEGSASFGTNTFISQWVHASNRLFFHRDSTILRRASSDALLILNPGSYFETLCAPSIYFGTMLTEIDLTADPTQKLGTSNDASIQEPIHGGPFKMKGDCNLPSMCSHHGAIVAAGNVTIGEHSSVFGDIKAKGDITIAANTVINGAVFAEGNIYLEKNALVKGPLVADLALEMRRGAVIGLPKVMTSVLATDIAVEQGAVVHGKIQARHIGMVVHS